MSNDSNMEVKSAEDVRFLAASCLLFLLNQRPLRRPPASLVMRKTIPSRPKMAPSNPRRARRDAGTKTKRKMIVRVTMARAHARGCNYSPRS
jgi:hypothetical protein